MELNSDIDAIEARFRTVSIAVFAATAALSLLLAWWLLRYTRRRRWARSSAARGSSGEGRLDYRIKLDSHDELGAVAHAFNGMAERLKSALDQAQNAQARADNANKAKSAFLANMSHELRTPMNAIIGYSEMMLETIEDGDELDPEEAAGDLGKIRSAGKHLLALINDVLDLAKVEAGKMTLYIEKVDGHACCRAREHGQAAAGEARQQVPPAERARLRRHPRRRHQVPPDPAEPAEQRGQVHRQGHDHAARLAHARRRDRAAQARGDRHRHRHERRAAGQGVGRVLAGRGVDLKGLRRHGLGLAICKKFAALMGGDITVKSKIGVGTTFTFVCPADGPPGQEAPAPITAAVAAAITTVLVVDDDESSRELSKRILEKEGYRVILADNGITGVSLAREHKPAAIVLDVVMPGMDGWQVLRELGKDAATKDIPVVMQSMLQQEELGEALGADDFLQKPVDRTRLTEAIKKLLPADGGETSILIVEEGSALTDKLREAMDGNPWKLEATSDLAHAGRAIDERAFSAVLIGFHSNTPGLGAFMRRVSRPGHAPMLLMDSVGMERNNAEHLIGFIKEQVEKREKEAA
jgi:signal transduction histidine kinase/CheY-like chemotaxis protein